MNPKTTFWRQLSEHLSTGVAAYVSVVADHTRHSPGTRGARMAVRPDGSQFGTIGGGVMEADILAQASAAFDQENVSSEIEILEHKRETGPRANPSGLICAGRQTMVYWLARPEHAAVYERFADAVAGDEEFELRVANGTPALVEKRVAPERAPLGAEEGHGVVYREHAVNRKRVAVVGGGHCGRALCRTMSQLGYHVTNVETREKVFTFASNEWADEKVVVDDYAEAASRVRFPELTHLVVMTAEMPSDARALLGAAGSAFPYVGVMGSSAKLAAIRKILAEAGVAEAMFRSWYAPIGLRMTSNTPEEIAISVAAQILREREVLFPWTRPSDLTGGENASEN